jgi:hypothetical protein
MSNLYKVDETVAEVAAHCGIGVPPPLDIPARPSHASPVSSFAPQAKETICHWRY